MAYIGMRNPVAAPITAYTEGSAITYGNGMILGPAVAANLTFDVADNPDYGNDVIIDNDNGINGYFQMSLPATIERIRLACRDQFTDPPGISHEPTCWIDEYPVTPDNLVPSK